MAVKVFKGGVALWARPEGDHDQLLAVDLTVRPQGPYRVVVLPLPLAADQAHRVEWLADPDPMLFTQLDALFHPLVHQTGKDFTPGTYRSSSRRPPAATVEGGIAVGRDALVRLGLTGSILEVGRDAVCVWARVRPPPRSVVVRWLGLNWGWPKAALAVRMPRPSEHRVVFPTRGLLGWPGAYDPGPTLYVQAPREPGPVWVDPEHAPGHPFGWRIQEREGPRPRPLDDRWPLFRAFSTARAATNDVVVELLDRGQRTDRER